MTVEKTLSGRPVYRQLPDIIVRRYDDFIGELDFRLLNVWSKGRPWILQQVISIENGNCLLAKEYPQSFRDQLNLAMMKTYKPTKCKNADKYKAIYPPKCFGGEICDVCQQKWENRFQCKLCEEEISVGSVYCVLCHPQETG